MVFCSYKNFIAYKKSEYVMVFSREEFFFQLILVLKLRTISQSPKEFNALSWKHSRAAIPLPQSKQIQTPDSYSSHLMSVRFFDNPHPHPRRSCPTWGSVSVWDSVSDSAGGEHGVPAVCLPTGAPNRLL